MELSSIMANISATVNKDIQTGSSTLKARVAPFVIFGTIAIIISLVVILFLSINVQKHQEKAFLEKEEEVKNLTGLEIAKRIATFLDKSVTPDGKDTGYSCKKTDQVSPCTPHYFDTVPQNIGYVALVYWQLYKMTADEIYKQKALQLADVLVKECQKNKEISRAKPVEKRAENSKARCRETHFSNA